MKKLCSKGHKISNADLKALEHYLLVSPKQWANDALKGMINKAVKTIYRDWIETYRKKTDTLHSSVGEIIMDIIEMPEFKPYCSAFHERETPQREDERDVEIWENGFDVEDYEDAALRAFYADPERVLHDFMENKVAKRKNALVKEGTEILLKENSSNPIYSKKDKFIKEFIKRKDYKNRKQRDEEEIEGLVE